MRAQVEHGFEFGGPNAGPLAIMLGLPAVCYALMYTCNSAACYKLTAPFAVPGFSPGTAVFSWQAVGVVVSWMLFMASKTVALECSRCL
jgi:hypothetical protein